MSKAVYLGGNLAVGFAREAMKTFPSVYMHVYIYVLYYIYIHNILRYFICTLGKSLYISKFPRWVKMGIPDT